MKSELNCHSCGEMRPEAFINVLSYMVKENSAWRNWRYCNDRIPCYQIAQQAEEEKRV